MVVDFARVDGVHQALEKTQDAGASVDRKTVRSAVDPMFAYMTTALPPRGVLAALTVMDPPSSRPMTAAPTGVAGDPIGAVGRP